MFVRVNVACGVYVCLCVWVCGCVWVCELWPISIVIPGEAGWEQCPYTEDALASKRLQIGAVVRHKSKVWTDRTRITEEPGGLSLAIIHIPTLQS